MKVILVWQCSCLMFYAGKLDCIYRIWENLPTGNFRVFRGQSAVNAKIKTGRNSHAPLFHMQCLWWVWFLALKREYYNRKHFF